MLKLPLRSLALGCITALCCAACAANSSTSPNGSPGVGDDAADDASPEAAADSGPDASDAKPSEAATEDSTAQDVTASDASVGPVGCITDVTAGHHKFTCKGIAYDVEVPTACASGGCGLVFDLHGMTMTGDQEDKNSGLRALAAQYGFVVVQPTAPASAMGPSWTPLVDDNKVWEVAQDTLAAFAIDPKKLHFAGFSQGGAMTWRLVCKHADAIASAAPVAGADASSWTVTPPYVLDCPFTTSNTPSEQIPILQMHGSADAVVPFAKGTAQRDALLTAWEMTEKEVVSWDAHYTWKRYTNTAGMIYEFIDHDYVVTTPLVAVNFAGHCLPGSEDINTNASLGQTMFFGCAPPNAMKWGETLLQFFQAHPKP